MPVIVAILFEDIPQEHQLGLQAVFTTASSGSVYQSRFACLLDEPPRRNIPEDAILEDTLFINPYKIKPMLE
jgi:hypothetical protein